MKLRHKKHRNSILFHCCIAIFLLAACGGGGKSDSLNTVATNETMQSEKKKPIINFYIENSGSMDGYVKGVTEFEQTIYSYLSDIKISGITDTLNLFYVNSKVIPYDSIADIKVISRFIEKLEPDEFRKRGGNRANTDISDVIKLVLKETQPNSISILVSDFIFSPEKTKNPEEYMLNQQIGIKNSIAAQFLRKIDNAAIVVYQLHSKFDGMFYYFDKTRGRELGKNYIGQRPFYLWLIGDVDNVAELFRQIPSDKFRGQSEVNVFSLVAGSKKVNYAVKPHSGNFNLSKQNPKTEIINLAKDKRSGKVTFAVNVDLSNLLLDEAYLTNVENYELNKNNYQMSIKTIPANEQGYTHTLSFTSDRVSKGEVIIKLKKQVPQWIYDADDEDGSMPELKKTYGLKYQIEGVYEGFTLKDKYYTEIKISIN